ncbi:MAG TPA: S41 family peptidase [Phycisphaerales bacterium]|nr:S41 family peptidase [Phycisphaerales bacterium]HMP36187.1 S41 family peptidase [Phycisphaerales bacterium]
MSTFRDALPSMALSILAAAGVALAMAVPRAVADVVDLPRHPSISPDGSEIVFSWRGDLWKVGSGGGLASRLTSHPQDELASAWSPDGRTIAFESDRDGTRNLHLMNPDGTGLRQVTQLDRAASLAGFGVDGEGRTVLTFHSTLEHDSYRSARPYMVSPDGGEALRVHDAFGTMPVVSPSGSLVLFERGGSSWSRRHYRGPDQRDVWLFDRRDGSFARLTEWIGNDGQARFLDDSTILFLSDRAGDTVNLWRLPLGGPDAGAEQVTRFSDADVVSFDVARDGRTAVVHSWDALHRVDLATGAVERLSIVAPADAGDAIEIRDVGRNVSEAQLSPDGKTLALVAFGDIYVRSVDDKSQTRTVFRGESRERDIAWSADGSTLYFVSDRDGADAIFAATVTATRSGLRDSARTAVTPIDPSRPAAAGNPGAASEPAPAADPASAPALDPTVDPGAGPGPDPPADRELRNAPAASSGLSPASGALSASASDVPGAALPRRADDGALRRASPSASADPPASDPPAAGAGSDDSAEVDAERSAPKPTPAELAKRWPDAVRFEIRSVIEHPDGARAPSPSPDGKVLAFRRGLGDLVLHDLADGSERVLVQGWDTGLDWAWSPDSRHIAYAQNDRNFNKDVFIVRADGSQSPVNITRHPDNDDRPRWSADGKVLVFLSERINNEADVWMVYLDKALEAMTPQEFEAYYKEAVEAARKRKPVGAETAAASPRSGARPAGARRSGGAGASGDPPPEADDREPAAAAEGGDGPEKKEEPAAAPPRELDLTDAWLRLRRMTSSPGREGNVEITPGGDRIIFSGSAAGAEDGQGGGLFSIKWDGSDRKRFGLSGSVQQVSLTGDRVVVVSGGRAATIRPDGGDQKFLDIESTIVIDRAEFAERRFRELARVLGQQFYHPDMKGLDWPALTDRYVELARATRTAEEFNFVANRFLGELNASHLGVSAPSGRSPLRQAQGRIGTVHRRDGDAFRIIEVYRESPAARAIPALAAGDRIVEVDFEAFGPAETLETRLRGRVGRETAFTVRRATEAGAVEFVAFITPISWEAQSRLAYEAWQESMRRFVDERSGGRVGYIHIQGMNQPELDKFERDLFAAAEGREALLIDVRNNGGGWTADRLLASIMVQPHAYAIPRGMAERATDAYPQDRLFIQRYSLPINMLCNEKSFSNAEITAHAFKTLGRGTLVGTQTYGGVISTGGFSLLDGTTVRLPFRGWYLLDGTDMENNGAIPDLVVPQTPEAESAGTDEQLLAALDDLLTRLR